MPNTRAKQCAMGIPNTAEEGLFWDMHITQVFKAYKLHEKHVHISRQPWFGNHLLPSVPIVPCPGGWCHSPQQNYLELASCISLCWVRCTPCLLASTLLFLHPPTHLIATGLGSLSRSSPSDKWICVTFHLPASSKRICKCLITARYQIPALGFFPLLLFLRWR